MVEFDITKYKRILARAVHCAPHPGMFLGKCKKRSRYSDVYVRTRGEYPSEVYFSVRYPKDYSIPTHEEISSDSLDGFMVKLEKKGWL